METENPITQEFSDLEKLAKECIASNETPHRIIGKTIFLRCVTVCELMSVLQIGKYGKTCEFQGELKEVRYFPANTSPNEYRLRYECRKFW